MKKLIFLLFAISLFAKDATVEQLFNIKTVKVQKKEINQKVELYGFSRPDESRIAHQTVRFDGYVESIKADKSFMQVKKGDELFTIYSNDLISAQNEFLNSLKFSSNKGSSYNKLRLLEIDEAIINKIANSKALIEHIPIRSKFEGVITEKTISTGSTIKNGAMLFTIVDFKKIWVLAKGYQSQKEFITLGQKAEISFDGVGKKYVGVVDFIYPEVSPKSKTYDIRIVLDNPNMEIFPNMFATVNILQAHKDELFLPKSAVITKGDKHIVFKKGEYEGEFEPLIIEAKRTGGGFMVLSGLNDGDEVANGSLFMLDSDAQINGIY